MSRRFGRNQRRKLREELAATERTLNAIASAYCFERQRSDNLAQQQRNAQDRYLQAEAQNNHLLEQNAAMLTELERCEEITREEEREYAENRGIAPCYGYADDLAALIARIKGGAV